MKEIGFDNEKYLTMQSQKIRDRIDQFGGKLYLEFGGKLFDDHHAARVLPGFQPDSKVRMLFQLKDQAEIVIVINADAIEKNKRRGDLGITYDLDALRLIDAFRGYGLYVGSVVITCYRGQPAAETFEKRLKNLGVKVYRHYPIADYPSNIPVCLSQLYHEFQRGVKAGYAKFETFPIWNLPLKHPVNLAYEAATADLNDVNMIDPFHLDAYGETTVNYNRDIEIYPVLSAMLDKIMGGASPYKSPTDMGVNMAGYCITDDAVVCHAAAQEIIRRYYASLCAVRRGDAEQSEVYRLELLMNQLGISPKDRPVVEAALTRAEETDGPAVALQLDDGRMVTGKTTALLGASAAVLLNALKALGGIQHDIALISPVIIEPIQELKVKHMGNHNPRLHTDEVLIALSICAATNPTAALAIDQLPKLRDCEAHSSVILSSVDESVFRKLGIHVTFEPKYQTKKLYHR